MPVVSTTIERPNLNSDNQCSESCLVCAFLARPRSSLLYVPNPFSSELSRSNSHDHNFVDSCSATDQDMDHNFQNEHDAIQRRYSDITDISISQIGSPSNQEHYQHQNERLGRSSMRKRKSDRVTQMSQSEYKDILRRSKSTDWKDEQTKRDKGLGWARAG